MAIDKRRVNTKYLAVLAAGTFFVLLGSIIGAAGAFRSVMADPESDGPLSTAENLATANPAGRNNYRHYVAVVSYFPEIFDCNEIRDALQVTTNDVGFTGQSTTSTFTNFANENLRDAVVNYCWAQSGNQAWIYALYFPILIVFLIVAFIAAFRRSGYQASIAGIGLSAFMLVYAALVIVQYQSSSNIPIVLDAFGDCNDFDTNAATLAAFNTPAPTLTAFTAGATWSPSIELAHYEVVNYNQQLNQDLGAGAAVATAVTAVNIARVSTDRGNTPNFDAPTYGAVSFAAAGATTTEQATAAIALAGVQSSASILFGSTPRKAFLCTDDFDYDNRLKVSGNLLYGGVAVVAFGLILVLVAFAYIAFPFIKVGKAPNADAQQKEAPLHRGAEFVDEYSEY